VVAEEGSMDKYILVGEKKSDSYVVQESDNDCEVKITQQGKPKNYISYAMTLFVSKTNDSKTTYCSKIDS
jgi:hypothetical protein